MVKLFGTTLEETRQAFTRPTAGGRNTQAGSKDDRIKSWVRIILTFLLLGLSIWLFQADKSKEVASSIIGAILGYWLK